MNGECVSKFSRFWSLICWWAFGFMETCYLEPRHLVTGTFRNPGSEMSRCRNAFFVDIKKNSTFLTPNFSRFYDYKRSSYPIYFSDNSYYWLHQASSPSPFPNSLTICSPRPLIYQIWISFCTFIDFISFLSLITPSQNHTNLSSHRHQKKIFIYYWKQQYVVSLQ